MIKYITALTIGSLIFFSCKKENENFMSTPVTDYFPLEVGKYITYDLDSTVYYINFGKMESIVHYQVQDKVEAQIMDNLGRAAYRIQRYQRKNATQPWVPNNTFMVVPTEKSIEFIENNLRFLKLELPVKQDFTWKGNAYLTPMAYDVYDCQGHVAVVSTQPYELY